MPKRSSMNEKRTDVNQMAKSIVDMVTGNPIAEEPTPIKKKDPLAVELGRRGGLKGGKRAPKVCQLKNVQRLQKKASTD